MPGRCTVYYIRSFFFSEKTTWAGKACAGPEMGKEISILQKQKAKHHPYFDKAVVSVASVESISFTANRGMVLKCQRFNEESLDHEVNMTIPTLKKRRLCTLQRSSVGTCPLKNSFFAKHFFFLEMPTRP